MYYPLLNTVYHGVVKSYSYFTLFTFSVQMSALTFINLTVYWLSRYLIHHVASARSVVTSFDLTQSSAGVARLCADEVRRRVDSHTVKPAGERSSLRNIKRRLPLDIRTSFIGLAKIFSTSIRQFWPPRSSKESESPFMCD